MKSNGFTLVELLVAISIVALIVGVALPNFVQARSRARDVKRKAEIVALKDAMRLYYNDYRQYPVVGGDGRIYGCGPTGNNYSCPSSNNGCPGDWTAGGNNGCQNVYMRKFPTDPFTYSPSADYQSYTITIISSIRVKPLFFI